MSYRFLYIRFLRQIIPADTVFHKFAQDCENFPYASLKFVAVAGCIDEALKFIREESPKGGHISSGGYRAQPLVFARLSRSGKTLFLMKLFEKLKSVGFSPIIITFNAGFALGSEKPVHAIARSISLQLGVSSSHEFSDKDVNFLLRQLDESTGTIVLLVDELNMLGSPIDEDASRFLTDHFLDRKDRQLVFTTHVFFRIDESLKVFSDRGYKMVTNLPISFDHDALKNIDSCTQSLTPLEIVMYGGIPALIYSMRKDSDGLQTVRDRVDALKVFSGEHSPMLLKNFIDEVLSGTKNRNSTDLYPFDQFSSLNTSSEMSWPLIFIICILDRFELCRHLHLIQYYRNLMTQAAVVKIGT